MIWDTLSVEITKFEHYLNFIDDESALVNLAAQRLKLANETMEKKPLNTTHNAVNFLNSLTYQNLQDIGIKNRVAIVLWAKKFINKHQIMKVMQDKGNQMSSQIKDFRMAFKDLFDDGLPYFWDDEGRLFSQEKYHSLLVQNRMDHSKFEDLVKGLTGKVIVEKLIEDFEILDRFLIIKK